MGILHGSHCSESVYIIIPKADSGSSYPRIVPIPLLKPLKQESSEKIMEPWWQTVAALGQDALIWLLGLATHGGTDRDKPPTIGAGRTSHAAHEVGKARRYATQNDLAFEATIGYRPFAASPSKPKTVSETRCSQAPKEAATCN